MAKRLEVRKEIFKIRDEINLMGHDKQKNVENDGAIKGVFDE